MDSCLRAFFHGMPKARDSVGNRGLLEVRGGFGALGWAQFR